MIRTTDEWKLLCTSFILFCSHFFRVEKELQLKNDVILQLQKSKLNEI